MEPFPLDFANISKATTHPQVDESTAEPVTPEGGVVGIFKFQSIFQTWTNV